MHLKADDIFRRAREAEKLSSPCQLCPRRCRARRSNGELGYCGAGPVPSVAAVIPHFGEEPPLVGQGGAGTMFFSRCNLRCVYCQNHRISQGPIGRLLSPHALAKEMLTLQRKGCSNVEPVSPSHHLPGLLEALALAVAEGLSLAIVYNTNGYESPDTLDLLEGIVDVYLPDLKYSNPEHASKYSDAPQYVETARAAILQMHRQVGNLVVDLHGCAVRGIIIRHLVLPEDISGTASTLGWIRDNLPCTITLSLLAQYSPLHRSAHFPPLDRKITPEEYETAIELAWEMGFENVFVQDRASTDIGIPDFDRDEPFTWLQD